MTEPARKGSVLLVEDSESVRLGLVVGLEDEFEVVEAANMFDALGHLATRSFEVVVTDQSMPGGSGCDLLDRIEKTCPTTIGILVTGHADSTRVKTLVDKSKDEGRVLVLYKPIETKDLKVWVRNGVAMSRLAKAKGVAT
jgi:DNA-binding NtrC family response regulator